ALEVVAVAPVWERAHRDVDARQGDLPREGGAATGRQGQAGRGPEEDVEDGNRLQAGPPRPHLAPLTHQSIPSLDTPLLWTLRRVLSREYGRGVTEKSFLCALYPSRGEGPRRAHVGPPAARGRVTCV